MPVSLTNLSWRILDASDITCATVQCQPRNEEA